MALIPSACLNHVKAHLKTVFRNHEKLFCHIKNLKMLRNYQKNFGKLKSAMEYENYLKNNHKYVVLTIQAVSAVFYIERRNAKLKLTKKHNLLKKIIEIINTCRHRSRYKLSNCEIIDDVKSMQ